MIILRDNDEIPEFGENDQLLMDHYRYRSLIAGLSHNIFSSQPIMVF